MSSDDAARLDARRVLVAAEAKRRYGTPQLTRSRSDLLVLQRLIDDGAFGRTETYELQSLGVVLGDVMASELPLRWVMVTDEFGAGPTLRFRDTTIQVNPLTMISKRVERGESVTVVYLLETTREQLSRVARQLGQ